MERPLPIDPPDPLAVEHLALAATGRPGRARVHSDPARSSTSNTAIQYTPMASIATVSTTHDFSHRAIASDSSGKLAKQRTGCSAAGCATAT